jgi:5-methyltetrahydrofolate--homocysteine methyltransferase
MLFLPMAIAAGMTSAIMNPVTLAVSKKQLEQKKLNLREAGIIVPDNFDDNLLAKITGMGSTVSSQSKEMEAINGANFLMNNDPNGAKWIKSNKIEGANQGARGRREGRRRR